MKLKQLAFLLPFVAVTANAEDIVISTDNNALVYNVADTGVCIRNISERN